MLTAQDLKNHIESKMNQCQAELIDLTGTQDHWQILVTAPEFEGIPLMEQHRRVQVIFEDLIQSGAVHALSIKTFTPARWAQRPTS